MPSPIKNDRMSGDQLAQIIIPLIKAELRRSDKLSSPSGLEFTSDGKLRIDIGQNPSLLAIDTSGLVTQYITATGSGANIGVKAVATGTGFTQMMSSATGQVRLEVGTALTTLILTATAAQFGAGATTFSIDSVSGLLGQIDADGGAVFRIEDTGSNSGAIVANSTELLLAGFLVGGIDGTPIRIQPQDSFISSPTVSVIGATGVDIQAGNVLVKGGATTGTAVNTPGGSLTLAGGTPTGTGTSQVLIEVQTSTGTFLKAVEVLRSGANAQLGFYAATPVSQQAVDIGIATVHAALVSLGLITSTGVTTPVGSGVPTGAMYAWTGPVGSPPSGYLIADGSAVSRTTYAALNALYSAAGYIHGNGDGATTFNLPLGTGKTILGTTGAGTGSTQGATGGTIDHTHDVNIAATVSGVDSGLGLRVASLIGASNVAGFGHTHTTDPANTTSTTNNPPFLSEHWIVKT